MDKQAGRGRLVAALISLAAIVAITIPAAAAAKDRNGNGIPDRWEKAYGLSLKKDQSKLDHDGDGLRNRGEWLAGLSPRHRDTDGDGISDRLERAGTISAWDPETLALEISLFAGGTASGTVSPSTKVKCPPAGAFRADVYRLPVTEPQGRNRGVGPRWPKPPRQRHGANCSLSDLAVGVRVDQADLRYSSTGDAVFTRLKIAYPAPAPEPVPQPDPIPEPVPAQ